MEAVLLPRIETLALGNGMAAPPAAALPQLGTAAGPGNLSEAARITIGAARIVFGVTQIVIRPARITILFTFLDFRAS